MAGLLQQVRGRGALCGRRSGARLGRRSSVLWCKFWDPMTLPPWTAFLRRSQQYFSSLKLYFGRHLQCMQCLLAGYYDSTLVTPKCPLRTDRPPPLLLVFGRAAALCIVAPVHPEVWYPRNMPCYTVGTDLKTVVVVCARREGSCLRLHPLLPRANR